MKKHSDKIKTKIHPNFLIIICCAIVTIYTIGVCVFKNEPANAIPVMGVVFPCFFAWKFKKSRRLKSFLLLDLVVCVVCICCTNFFHYKNTKVVVIRKESSKPPETTKTIETTPAPVIPDNEGMEAEFVWEEDIFLTNIQNSVEHVLSEWGKNRQKENRKPLSAKELNSGRYGELIDQARKYFQDYKRCTTDDVKLYALKKALALKKEANEVYETYTNLKEIGVWLLEESHLDLDGSNDEETLIMEAIKNFIKALDLAYASNDQIYIKAIWKELAGAYSRLANLSGRDIALCKKANEISVVCEKMCR